MNILLKVVLFLMGDCDVIMYIFSHQLALFATLWLMKLKIRKSAYLKNG